MGLYSDKITGINDGFVEVKTKLTDLNAKLEDLVVTLSLSSGDDITNMTTDINNYIAKIDAIITAVDQQMATMNLNASKFDGWYNLYTSKIGYRYNADDYLLKKGFLGFKKDYAKVEYTKVFENSSGLIEIDYTVYKKTTKWWGLKNGAWVEVPASEAEETIVEDVVAGTNEEIIPEMNNFTGGTAS